MPNNSSVYDTIASKTWISEGAVRHHPPGAAKPHLYPKTGMQFTPHTMGNLVIPKPNPPLVKHRSNGQGYDDIPYDVPAHNIRTLTISIDQRYQEEGGKVPRIDPATKKPVVLFSPDYIAAFSRLPFYEQHGVLVSPPMLVPGERDLAVSFIIEVYYEGNYPYMLQRSFWNGAYIGTYCCG